jgi:hypothetical protein
MSQEHFDDNCPGCKPALLDIKTGKALPPEHPIMQIVDGIWAKTTLEERQAFHRVTCLNSEAPADVSVMVRITTHIEDAIKAMEELGYQN